MGVCYDIEGNSVDCGGSDAVGYSAGVSASDYGAGLDLTSNSPVAVSASNPSGSTSLFDKFLNFGTSALNLTAKALGSSQTSSNLRLQVNPTTGKMQYFNPSTGQYVGGPIASNTGFLGGSSNSFLLIIVAVVVAFFAFGGRKRLTA